jgi:hypothetical protein
MTKEQIIQLVQSMTKRELEELEFFTSSQLLELMEGKSHG